MIRCPRCHGRRFHAYKESEDDRWLRRAPCGPCLGTGRVTHEQAERIIHGRNVRRARAGGNHSLASFARRLGVSVVELSRIEAGL